MSRAVRPRTKAKLKNKLPKMRLRRAWRHYPAGAVIQPPGTLRTVLVQQGIGEVVEEEKAPEPKRRGRPPKVKQDDEEGESDG